MGRRRVDRALDARVEPFEAAFRTLEDKRRAPMAHIHIAAISEQAEPVLAAVRELGDEKVILVGEDREGAEELSRVLEPLGVETEHREAGGHRLPGRGPHAARQADSQR